MNLHRLQTNLWMHVCIENEYGTHIVHRLGWVPVPVMQGKLTSTTFCSTCIYAIAD